MNLPETQAWLGIALVAVAGLVGLALDRQQKSSESGECGCMWWLQVFVALALACAGILLFLSAIGGFGR